MGKGEIARYEQFLLFLQCFQKACFPGASKGVIVWEWVKPLLNIYSFRRINNRQLLKTLWRKGEIARNEQFLLFPQCFQLNQITVSPFVHIFDIISGFGRA